MAYDDDSSFFDRFRDWSQLERLLREYFLRENLSIDATRQLIRSLAQLTQDRTAQEITLLEIQNVLRQNRLESLPTETVVNLLQLVEPVSGREGDIFDHITLNDIDRVLSRPR